MDTAAELGRNPVSKHQVQPEYEDEQADAGRDCRNRLARPNSQARTRTGENFPCSADHEQDGQPYQVDPYSCYMFVHTVVVASEGFRRNSFEIRYVVRATLPSAKLCNDGECLWSTKIS